jgi:hypothetical protein
MSDLRQHAYELSIPSRNETITIQSINTNSLFKPTELMGVVSQHGRIKIHAVVDLHTDDSEELFLVVGTGNRIPGEYADRLFRLGTVLINDDRHGYTVYWIKHKEESISETIVIKLVLSSSIDAIDAAELANTIKNGDFIVSAKEDVSCDGLFINVTIALSDWEDHENRGVILSFLHDSPYVSGVSIR